MYISKIESIVYFAIIKLAQLLQDSYNAVGMRNLNATYDRYVPTQYRNSREFILSGAYNKRVVVRTTSWKKKL